jgi:putative transposase
MGLARSTYCDLPVGVADDTAIVETLFAVCDGFGFYGCRRAGAALRQLGLTVNHKKLRRLMREHVCSPMQFEIQHDSRGDNLHLEPVHPKGRTPFAG